MEIVTGNINPFPIWISNNDFGFRKLETKIDKYIINENATIIFWTDHTKTVSKRHKDDEFDVD